MDGAPHNFAIYNDSNEAIVQSETMSNEGGTQTVQFTTTQEMGYYQCDVHPNTMAGQVELVQQEDSTLPVDPPVDAPVEAPEQRTSSLRGPRVTSVVMQPASMPRLSGRITVYFAWLSSRGLSIAKLRHETRLGLQAYYRLPSADFADAFLNDRSRAATSDNGGSAPPLTR